MSESGGIHKGFHLATHLCPGCGLPGRVQRHSRGMTKRATRAATAAEGPLLEPYFGIHIERKQLRTYCVCTSPSSNPCSSYKMRNPTNDQKTQQTNFEARLNNEKTPKFTVVPNWPEVGVKHSQDLMSHSVIFNSNLFSGPTLFWRPTRSPVLLLLSSL